MSYYSGDIYKGDIFYVNFDNSVGSEQKGVRPAVVVQNNVGNKYSSTIIVAAITSKYKCSEGMPMHIFLPSYRGILPEDSVILCEQIKTIDRSRLLSYKGKLEHNEIEKLNMALAISLGIDTKDISDYFEKMSKYRHTLNVSNREYSNLDLMCVLVLVCDNLQHTGNLELSSRDILSYAKELIKGMPKKDILKQLDVRINNRLNHLSSMQN